MAILSSGISAGAGAGAAAGAGAGSCGAGAGASVLPQPTSAAEAIRPMVRIRFFIGFQINRLIGEHPDWPPAKVVDCRSGQSCHSLRNAGVSTDGQLSGLVTRKPSCG